MKRSLLAALALSLLIPALSAASGQTLSPTPKADARLFALEDVRPGQRGVARTVFQGTEPEEFGVEILGVLAGFPGPRQSAIIARLSGKNVDRTGVFAGMSGSPVYIDGRLVGAIAFSFPFSREPIAGITPIKQMLDVFEQGDERNTRSPQEPHSVSFAQLAATDWHPILPKPAVTGMPLIAPVSQGSPLIGLLGQQFQPIATPVVFGGISQDALASFAPQLVAHGLLPVSGVGGAAAITPLAQANEHTLAPGTSVSVQLVRGDYSIAAFGTVTYRDAQRIYAFGHPFLSLGQSDMPMSEASVVTVISNMNNSFKLSNPGQMVGSISQDRSTGIFGQLGRAPKMISVKISLHTSRNHTDTYNFEVANDDSLTPLLMNLTVYNTIMASERGMGDSTIAVSGQIDIAGQQPVHLERRFSSGNAPVLAAGSFAVPLATLMTSGFDNVRIGG